nr:hypothetical protein [Tanacetum cinerariifolium]
VAEAEAELPENNAPRTEFTEIEREAFLIVKTILRPIVDSARVVHRDTISYLNVLLDDNNRKTICRLWLNGAKCIKDPDSARLNARLAGVVAKVEKASLTAEATEVEFEVPKKAKKTAPTRPQPKVAQEFYEFWLEENPGQGPQG